MKGKWAIASLVLVGATCASALVRPGAVPAPLSVEAAPVWEAAPYSAALDTLARPEDPVVATGNQFPPFQAVALGKMFLYAYRGGVWLQIPSQFDEVDVNGNVVSFETGKLDANAQLVFMASDAGDQAPPDSWISDADSRNYPRAEIAVSDPLSPTAHAWAYLYRSNTLIETVLADYVSFDAGQSLFTAGSYRLGMLNGILGFDRLEMNGSGVDVLDRTKMRAQVSVVGATTEQNLNLTSNNLIHDGRVRVVHRGVSMGFSVTTYAYRAMFRTDLKLDMSKYGLSLTRVRLSADMNPAVAPSTYYDANVSAGVAIDGSPDAVPAAPYSHWRQISGGTGSAVQVADIRQVGGAATNYYLDNSATDSKDTGDKQSFADSGALIEGPNQRFTAYLWYFVLPANQPNVGAAFYRELALNPLQCTTAMQNPPSASPTPTPSRTPTRTSTPTRTRTPTATRTPPPRREWLPVVRVGPR